MAIAFIVVASVSPAKQQSSTPPRLHALREDPATTAGLSFWNAVCIAPFYIARHTFQVVCLVEKALPGEIARGLLRRQTRAPLVILAGLFCWLKTRWSMNFQRRVGKPRLRTSQIQTTCPRPAAPVDYPRLINRYGDRDNATLHGLTLVFLEDPNAA